MIHRDILSPMGPRYSSRLQWSIAPNALSIAFEKQRRSNIPILDLTQSNPTAAGIIYPPIHHALASAAVMHYEPVPRGLLDARQAVSDYYGNAVPPERILLTSSTSEAYSYLFKLLCDPGSEVLVPRPSYPLFDMLAQLECVQVVQYPLHYHDGWFVDLATLRDAITERTRMVVFVNPNNPTGSYLKRREYAEIASLCCQHGLALISDEVFSDYPLAMNAEAMTTLTHQSECLSFSLSGLSKVCGLPQMKLGWIVTSGPGHQQALQRLEWIADTFLSVGTPVQCAAHSLLEARHPIQQQIRTRTAANLELVSRGLKDSPCRVLHVEGGWYVTLQVPRIRSEEAWTLELLNRGVLVHPGFFFDFEAEAFLVISLLTETSILEQGMKHILDGC
jgi:alanine-synthesizing transaminase